MSIARFFVLSMFLSNFLRSVFIWFRQHGEKILVFIALVLIGAFCFEAGLLYGKLNQDEKPLVISLPSSSESPVSEPKKTENKTLLEGVEPIANTGSAECVFVGSKNSNKYHLPKCAPAKRIKPENRVCFSSQEDAQKKGYLPGCLE